MQNIKTISFDIFFDFSGVFYRRHALGKSDMRFCVLTSRQNFVSEKTAGLLSQTGL